MNKWKVEKLSDVCLKIQDGAHSSPQKLYEQGGEGRFLYITSKNIRNNYMDLRKVSYVDSDFHNSIFPRCNPEFGDVLLTKDGVNTGNVTLNTLRVPFSLLSSVCLIKANPHRLLPSFLVYYIQSKYGFEQITGQMTGAAIKRIILRTIKNSTIPLPPLAEQKRIVAILDEAFEGIDAAIANTEKNLANARELFESYLNAIFTRTDDLPTVSIGDVGEVFDGPHATPKTIDSGPIFLGISSLQDGQIRLEKTRHVSAEDYKKWTRRVEPRADDIVFSYETRLGQAAIIPKEFQCCLGRRMGLVRFDKSKVEPRYFLYLYLSPPYRKFLDEKTIRGATVDRISIKEFPSFPVPLPSMDDQRDVVARVENFSQQAQRLEAIYQQKLTALNELKQSILQKAFSGELTAEVGDAAGLGAKEVIAA